PFVIMLSGFALLQARYTQQGEAIIGYPVAGRSSPLAEQTAGHFVNLLTLRLPLDGGTVAGFIQQVRDSWLAALTRADYPFPRILGALQASQGAAALRIPPAAMVWHQANAEWVEQFLGSGRSLLQGAGDIWPGSGQRGAAYPLVLAVQDRGQDFRLEWTCDSALFDAPAVQRRAADFLHLLDQLLHAAPDTALALPLLRPSVLQGPAALPGQG